MPRLTPLFLGMSFPVSLLLSVEASMVPGWVVAYAGRVAVRAECGLRCPHDPPSTYASTSPPRHRRHPPRPPRASCTRHSDESKPAGVILLLALAVLFDLVASIGLFARCLDQWRVPSSMVTLACGILTIALHTADVIVFAVNAWDETGADTLHSILSGSRIVGYLLGSIALTLAGVSILAYDVLRARHKAKLVERHRRRSGGHGSTAPSVMDVARHRQDLRSFTLYQAQLTALNVVAVWYVLVGSFLFLGLERWLGDEVEEHGKIVTFDDMAYFCVVSMTTVGLGDFTLKSTAAQLVFPFYATLGLLVFGMTIYMIRQVILEFLAIRLSFQLYRILCALSSDQEVGIAVREDTLLNYAVYRDNEDDDASEGGSEHVDEEIEAEETQRLLQDNERAQWQQKQHEEYLHKKQRDPQTSLRQPKPKISTKDYEQLTKLIGPVARTSKSPPTSPMLAPSVASTSSVTSSSVLLPQLTAHSASFEPAPVPTPPRSEPVAIQRQPSRQPVHTQVAGTPLYATPRSRYQHIFDQFHVNIHEPPRTPRPFDIGGIGGGALAIPRIRTITGTTPAQSHAHYSTTPYPHVDVDILTRAARSRGRARTRSQVPVDEDVEWAQQGDNIPATPVPQPCTLDRFLEGVDVTTSVPELLSSTPARARYWTTLSRGPNMSSFSILGPHPVTTIRPGRFQVPLDSIDEEEASISDDSASNAFYTQPTLLTSTGHHPATIHYDPAIAEEHALQNELVLLALRNVLWRQFKYAAAMVTAYIVLVSAIMCAVERWSFGRSVYFVFASVTTIGYGDVVPITVLGKSLYMWFLILGIGLVTYLGSVIAEVISNQWKIQTGAVQTGL